MPQRPRLLDPGPTAGRTGTSDPDFAERYRAISARDTRFDGQFVTAVATTGIYCRPSCPARTPRPENVTFFRTSAAAHEAGYRACRRCLPEATPGTPEWDLRGDLAARAMRLIVDGAVDRVGVDGLAERLGYSARHVHRVLTDELGAGPVALARAHRAQSARALLVGTTLPLSEVAFAAGFGSIRQFNDTIGAIFAATPRELRDRARRGDVPSESPLDHDDAGRLLLTLRLPVRSPFDAPGLFRYLAVRAIPGVESARSDPDGTLRFARTLRLPHGPGAFEIAASPTLTGEAPEWSVRLTLELSSLADATTAVARVRRLCDLDADPAAVDEALAADPALRPLVSERPGVRVPGTVDPHELVLRTIVGQQISVAAARTHLARLVRLLGRPYASSLPGLDRVFPTPVEILDGLERPDAERATSAPDPDRPLRLPARSLRTIVDTAGALSDGTLTVDVAADRDALRRDLLDRPGIGPWTASYVGMRVSGDPDAWPVGDVALLNGARAAGVVTTEAATTHPPHAHRDLARRAVSWAPWRSYAAVHLWRAAEPSPTDPSPTTPTPET